MSSSPKPGSWLEITIILLVALVIGAPLLTGSVLAGYDIVTYLIYAQQTAANLREGIILPAWAADLDSGFGGPGLMFYPPLTHFLHGLPVLLGLPLHASIGPLVLVPLFLSGLAVRHWLRAAGRGEGALPAAVLYMIAPYRLADLYERSGLAEHWAFLWPPLILWAGTETSLSPHRRSAWVAVFSATLLLTNLPLAVLFGLTLGAWYLLPGGPAGKRLSTGAGALLAIALAAFALVPQALSAQWLKTDMWYGSSNRLYRPSSNTLFNPTAIFPEWNLRISWCLLLTVLLACLTYFRIDPQRRRSPSALFWCFISFLCLLAALRPAGALWDASPILSQLQFPWRTCAPATLGLVGLVSLVPRARAWLIVLLAAVVSVPFYGRSTLPLRLFASARPAPVSPGRVFPDPEAVWEAGGTRSIWFHARLHDVWFLPKTVAPPLEDEILGRSSSLLDWIRQRPAALVDDPAVPVEIIEWSRLEKRIRIGVPRQGRLVWHIMAFPGMEAEVDGTATPSAADPATGLFAHVVPAGRHEVLWRWRPFPPLPAFRLVSLVALLMLSALFAWPRPTRRAAASPAHPG